MDISNKFSFRKGIIKPLSSTQRQLIFKDVGSSLDNSSKFFLIVSIVESDVYAKTQPIFRNCWFGFKFLTFFILLIHLFYSTLERVDFTSINP